MSEDTRRDAEDDDAPFDPDRRELCSDGMCVGVIGKDGRCKVCGKPGSGATPVQDRAGSSRAAAADWRPGAVPGGEEDVADEEDFEGSGEGGASSTAGGRPDFERTRVPCSDDMCTGIIGRNGRCGTCGKPWSGSDG